MAKCFDERPPLDDTSAIVRTPLRGPFAQQSYGGGGGLSGDSSAERRPQRLRGVGLGRSQSPDAPPGTCGDELDK